MLQRKNPFVDVLKALAATLIFGFFAVFAISANGGPSCAFPFVVLTLVSGVMTFIGFKRALHTEHRLFG